MSETWDEWGGIVGPWPDADAAERAVREAIAVRKLETLEEHTRGFSIARIYEIGPTAWISGETALVATLAGEGRRIFGAVPDYDDDDRFVGRMRLFELVAKRPRVLHEKQELPAEAAEYDGLDDILEAEVRAAGRAIGAQGSTDSHRHVYYDGDF